jgi:hypothetical protein
MVFDIETALIQLIVNILVNLIFVSPFLWIAGRLLAGKQKAKFTDSLWIILIGTVVFYFFNYLLTDALSGVANIIAYIAMFVIWLALIKHFFDCGWPKALAITIITVIIAIIILFVIVFVLALIGIGAG